eukprot:3782023-Pleurochrysis_carterae.AAC.1
MSRLRGGHKDSDNLWSSARTAAYPPDLNFLFARILASAAPSANTASHDPEPASRSAADRPVTRDATRSSPPRDSSHDTTPAGAEPSESHPTTTDEQP